MTKTTTADQPDLLGPTPPPRTRFRGGYQPKPGPKPKLPTTGSGVRPPKQAQKKPSTAIAVHQPQAVAAPKTIAELIWAALKDSTINTDKMKEMIALAREQEMHVAERAFNDAMREVAQKMPPVVRRKHNKHTNSKWAPLEEVSKVADPIIHAHGFTLSYGMANSPIDEHYRITCDVSHQGGFTKHYFADIGADSKGPKGEGTKSLAQGSGSSISYGRRYLKAMIFDIKIVGEDNDGMGAEIEGQRLSSEQAEKLLALCAEKHVSKEQFVRAFQVLEIADLPAHRFDEAMSRIGQKATPQ